MKANDLFNNLGFKKNIHSNTFLVYLFETDYDKLYVDFDWVLKRYYLISERFRDRNDIDFIPMEERPHILQTGHIHQAFYMKQGKTHCFQTSCLQDLTPYERSMGFNNDKSCWWVDVIVDKNGNPIQIKQELETFGKKLVRKK